MKNHKRRWMAVLILSAQLCAVTACSSKSNQEVKNGVPVQKTAESEQASEAEEAPNKYGIYERPDGTKYQLVNGETVELSEDEVSQMTADGEKREKAAAKAVAAGASESEWYKYLDKDDPLYEKYQELGETPEDTTTPWVNPHAENVENAQQYADFIAGGGSFGKSAMTDYEPTDGNGNTVERHDVDLDYDFRTEMAPGLHQDAMYDDPSTWSITIDECFITMQQCTVNSFMANTAHEWHFYDSKGEGPATLEPGEKGMCHLDSSYFSSPENKKTGTNKKNGQLVFYVKNTDGSAKSILDCTVYKVYISYISHGYDDYSEIPIVDYMGYQILDSAAKIADCSYFGEPRERKTLTDCDGYRYEFGSISNTRIMMDTLNTSSGELLLGITVESPI